MGGDRGYAKGPGVVTSPGGLSDHRYDRDTWGGRGVRVPPGGVRNGIFGTTPHKGVH